MKRYHHPHWTAEPWRDEMIEHPEGDWVRYDDVKALDPAINSLQREVEALKAELKRTELFASALQRKFLEECSEKLKLRKDFDALEAETARIHAEVDRLRAFARGLAESNVELTARGDRYRAALQRLLDIARAALKGEP